MSAADSPIFSPVRIGPVTLRNRVIRSAAFENMAYGNKPSQDLMDYHVAVARGGVGMTTLAYASVCRSGLSFDGQLWMREEIVPALRKITDAVHAQGAKASIQLGHCGNMTHRATCGCMPVGASGGFSAEAFARASRRGWEWAAENPEETVEIVMKYVSESHVATNSVLQRLMLDEILRLQRDSKTGRREFLLRPDMVQQASRHMVEAGLLKKNVDYEMLIAR